MCNYYQYNTEKVSRARGKNGVECLDFFFFPVKRLAKFGSATTQRSEVVLNPLLCLKMKSKQDRNPSELQLYGVIETKKIKKKSSSSSSHSSSAGWCTVEGVL